MSTEGERARQTAEAGVTSNDDWTPYTEEMNGVEMALVPQDDPTGPESGDSRVVRGGSRSNYSSDVRTANRGRADPSSTSNGDTFRCARDYEP